MKRMALVGLTVLVGALVFGLGATAGAANYPPTAKTVTVAANSVSRDLSAAQGAAVSRDSSAAQGAALPRTGGDSMPLVWAGGVLLVAGSALVVRGRRRAVRS